MCQEDKREYKRFGLFAPIGSSVSSAGHEETFFFVSQNLDDSLDFYCPLSERGEKMGGEGVPPAPLGVCVCFSLRWWIVRPRLSGRAEVDPSGIIF